MQAFAFQRCFVSDWEFIQAYEWDEYVQFIMLFSLRLVSKIINLFVMSDRLCT